MRRLALLLALPLIVVTAAPPPQYVAHPTYVKGFRHHDGYGLGMRLLFTWLDK